VISHKKLEEQMKRINFHHNGWGRSEISELCNVIMPDEEIEECVNGWYEAGFALLVATKDRVLLVDKKPLGYLTVEDMRFDMINELDLHHRLLGAQIRISAGAKTLLFTSLNQARLRRLLNFVQARMIQIKRETTEQRDAQKQHLEEMNEQLRLYLMAAHKQQYLDQAMTLQHSGQAPLVFENPHMQIAPAAAMQQFEPAPDQEASQPQPKTSFERAAAAAFDGRQAVTSASPQQTQEPSGGPVSGILQTTSNVLHGAESALLTPQQVGLAAVRRVVPIVTAYTRFPVMNRRHYQPPRTDTRPEAA
jgi:hypothetical protein